MADSSDGDGNGACPSPPALRTKRRASVLKKSDLMPELSEYMASTPIDNGLSPSFFEDLQHQKTLGTDGASINAAQDDYESCASVGTWDREGDEKVLVSKSFLHRILEYHEKVLVSKSFLQRILKHYEGFTLKGEKVHSEIHSILYGGPLIARRNFPTPPSPNLKEESDTDMKLRPKKKRRGPYNKTCSTCKNTYKEKACPHCKDASGVAKVNSKT
jgi:hypothetical protein